MTTEGIGVAPQGRENNDQKDNSGAEIEPRGHLRGQSDQRSTEDDDAAYPGGWFGPSWGAPVNDESQHLPTPVGQECMDCREVFVHGDQGLTMPGVRDGEVYLSSIHIACFRREVGIGC